MRALAFLARRFVAGETAEDAVAVGGRLHERGIRATFDLLGEDVLDREAARRCAAANEALLRAIPDGIDRNISIKLTMMGFDISEDFCLELTSGILDTARERNAFVRIDMEGSKHTQRTLAAFRKLRTHHENVGIVLQAYLHRTEQDVKEAIARRDRVRLCKGAYNEPPSIAWTDMDEIRASYPLRALASRPRELPGPRQPRREPGAGRPELHARAAERFEFQMLYGLRPRRWDELVRAGYKFRVYVPFGTHWFPYFYRRLRERRENVFFVLRNLLGG
jgi:proline dehydrogenase